MGNPTTLYLTRPLPRLQPRLALVVGYTAVALTVRVRKALLQMVAAVALTFFISQERDGYQALEFGRQARNGNGTQAVLVGNWWRGRNGDWSRRCSHGEPMLICRRFGSV